MYLSLLFDVIYYGVLAAFIYSILYQRVFLMYYRYMYYRLQGIPSVGFPLPVIGNVLQFMRSLKTMNGFSKTPLENYFEQIYGPPGTPDIPPIFVDFRMPNGIVVVTDPKYVDELYVGKNKFFDKCEKERQIYH